MVQLSVFSRNRQTRVDALEDGAIRAVCHVSDLFSEAEVTVIAEPPELTIREASARVFRADIPWPEDMETPLKNIAGVRIGPGMLEILKGLLVFDPPCPDLVRMVEEACQAVILSLTRKVLAKAPADDEGKIAFFSDMVKKNVRLYNRCAAFAPGSRLVEGVDPEKKPDTNPDGRKE